MWIDVNKCKRGLATVWMLGAGVVFAVMLAQSFLGHYGDDLASAWGWVLPTILPTLFLIIGVLVADTGGSSQPPRKVDRFLFRLSIALSVAYLLVVLATIVIQPISPLPPPELMRQSHLWLAPFQAIVSGCLGAFFVRRESG